MTSPRKPSAKSQAKAGSGPLRLGIQLAASARLASPSRRAELSATGVATALPAFIAAEVIFRGVSASNFIAVWATCGMADGAKTLAQAASTTVATIFLISMNLLEFFLRGP